MNANTQKRTWGSRSGSAMVEFAIGASILVTCFAGAFSYGYAFYRYNTLHNAVNAGARYAALATWDSVSTSATTSFETEVKNVVVYGNPAGGSVPVVPGLTTSHVSLTPTTVRLGGATIYTPTHMRVAINNFSVNALFRTITFNGKPTVRYRYNGLLTPVAGGN
jgi:hypothetical protein